MNNTRHITLSFSCSLNGNYGTDKIKAILKTNKNQIKALGKMVLLAFEVVSVYCLENPQEWKPVYAKVSACWCKNLVVVKTPEKKS